ncbi:MAG: class I adenylate-forming enzyme family protein [Myxococcota bacterium]
MAEPQSLGALFPSSLLAALAASPDSPAFEVGSRVISRGELLQLIRRLVLALRAQGFAPRRGLAIYTSVSPQAFALQMAAHVLGCRVVGIRPGYTTRQLAHVLAMDVAAVVVDSTTATPDLFAATGAMPILSLGAVDGAVDLLLSVEDATALDVLANPDDVAALFFTSGSTGQPKGCAMTYRALSCHWAWKGPSAWSPFARQLAAASRRHLVFGTLASLVVMEFLAPCLLGGGTAVIPEPDARPLFPNAIARYGITSSIITVPRLYQMLDSLSVESVDVSSLRALMVSGSPLSARRLASAVERLGPVLCQGYGQTEAGSISMLTWDDLTHGPLEVFGSVGRPHPAVELRVLDEQGKPVPLGEVGELYVRSPYAMTGYWGMPEETQDTLRDGWVRTRDLARIDAGGYLYLVGRTRDVILVNALVVYAGAIERVLAAHPDVDQAYVTGAPDAHTGEAIHAFVVPAMGRTPDLAGLCGLIRNELGADFVPKTITTIASAPVAASGKPDKRALLTQHGVSVLSDQRSRSRAE